MTCMGLGIERSIGLRDWTGRFDGARRLRWLGNAQSWIGYVPHSAYTFERKLDRTPWLTKLYALRLSHF